MTGATQLCESCGSPLRPCKCQRAQVDAQVRGALKRKPFADIRTPERYGPMFDAIRELPCWLCEEGYDGPGHREGEYLELGEQGGHTAHHVGRYDEEGLIPVDGKAHDLVANRGSRTTQKHFRAWLDQRGQSLKEVGLEYVDAYRKGGLS